MLILATDMARHSEILESFKSKLDSFDFKNEDHLNSVSIAFQDIGIFISGDVFQRNLKYLKYASAKCE